MTLIIAFVAALSGLAAAALTVYQHARRRRPPASGDEPGCGRCGYVIHPGSRRICPECGDDLAAVGVARPSERPPAFPYLAVWALAVGLGLVAQSAGPRLAAATPWGWTFKSSAIIPTPRTVALHRASRVGSFALDASGIGRERGVRVRQLLVTYVPPTSGSALGSRGVALSIDPQAHTCRIFQGVPLSRTPLPLTRQSVNQFVQMAGFDPDDVEGASFSSQVFDQVQRFLNGDLPSNPESAASGLALTIYTRDPAAAWFASGCVWVVGMALVLWGTLRHLRRRRTDSAARRRHTLESLNLQPAAA
jgi:hypothetical protein